jgi:Histidine kinase-, DNA gyrase B-, and HSP90-like ATPase
LSDVFFLGAGASKAICPSLPLASELTVASLLDRSTYEHDADPSAAIAEIQKALNSGALPKGLLAQPLEDVLDELPERESPFAREHLLICVMERLSFSTSDTLHFGSPEAFGRPGRAPEREVRGRELIRWSHEVSIRNLVENALRHGGGSPVAVSVSREIGGIGSIDGLTVLEVADYGPGVPGDAREQIFEPLFRLPSRGKRRRPRSRPRPAGRPHHGGDVVCLPRKGGGSRFRVTLR